MISNWSLRRTLLIWTFTWIWTWLRMRRRWIKIWITNLSWLCVLFFSSKCSHTLQILRRRSRSSCRTCRRCRVSFWIITSKVRVTRSSRPSSGVLWTQILQIWMMANAKTILRWWLTTKQLPQTEATIRVWCSSQTRLRGKLLTKLLSTIILRWKMTKFSSEISHLKILINLLISLDLKGTHYSSCQSTSSQGSKTTDRTSSICTNSSSKWTPLSMNTGTILTRAYRSKETTRKGQAGSRWVFRNLKFTITTPTQLWRTSLTTVSLLLKISGTCRPLGEVWIQFLKLGLIRGWTDIATVLLSLQDTGTKSITQRLETLTGTFLGALPKMCKTQTWPRTNTKWTTWCWIQNWSPLSEPTTLTNNSKPTPNFNHPCRTNKFGRRMIQQWTPTKFHKFRIKESQMGYSSRIIL